MKKSVLQLRLGDWVEKQVSLGREAFSLNQIRKEFPNQSDAAITLALNRLSRKEKIVSVHKGYYAIVPPQYAMHGIVPADVFIDGLMRFLLRPYYVGLLNAAAFYGAAHQAPQEYFVFTNFPVMRPTQKKGIKINYISKKQLSENLLENKKTQSGYLKTSSPELTAADLVQFEKRIGGLSRAATVIKELVSEIEISRINAELVNAVLITTVQRLGYLLEFVLFEEEMANALYNVSISEGKRFQYIPLKTSKSGFDMSVENRWKIIVNSEIEVEE